MRLAAKEGLNERTEPNAADLVGTDVEAARLRPICIALIDIDQIGDGGAHRGAEQRNRHRVRGAAVVLQRTELRISGRRHAIAGAERLLARSVVHDQVAHAAMAHIAGPHTFVRSGRAVGNDRVVEHESGRVLAVDENAGPGTGTLVVGNGRIDDRGRAIARKDRAAAVAAVIGATSAGGPARNVVVIERAVASDDCAAVVEDRAAERAAAAAIVVVRVGVSAEMAASSGLGAAAAAESTPASARTDQAGVTVTAATAETARAAVRGPAAAATSVGAGRAITVRLLRLKFIERRTSPAATGAGGVVPILGVRQHAPLRIAAGTAAQITARYRTTGEERVRTAVKHGSTAASAHPALRVQRAGVARSIAAVTPGAAASAVGRAGAGVPPVAANASATAEITGPAVAAGCAVVVEGAVQHGERSELQEDRSARAEASAASASAVAALGVEARDADIAKREAAGARDGEADAVGRLIDRDRRGPDCEQAGIRIVDTSPFPLDGGAVAL